MSVGVGRQPVQLCLHIAVGPLLRQEETRYHLGGGEGQVIGESGEGGSGGGGGDGRESGGGAEGR